MLTKSPFKIVLICSVSIAALCACSVQPEPMSASELVSLGAADRAKMFGQQEPIKRPLTVSDAIARTIKYNLDRRVKMMEEALAFDQTKLDSIDLLPKMAANAGYTSRSDKGATSSHDITTDSIGNPSYSLDQRRNFDDLGLSWNVLDFGISWYTANQNADRALIAAERRRKVLINLVQEVRGAYWRAVGAEMIRERAAKVIAEATQVLQESRNVRNEQLRMPLDVLRFEKTILENMRLLRLIEAEAIAAKSELAALISADPATNFPLAMPGSSSMRIPNWSMPQERMEELAFTRNADLREQIYQARVSVAETKKAILRTLPSVNFTVSKQYDSNSLLMNNSWADAGARLSWNLFNIAAIPRQMDFSDATKELTEQRILAVRMATLAQVQISSRMFTNAREQFRIADELFRVDKGIAEAVLARQEKSVQGRAEVVASETILITSELRRFTTYAAMQVAISRIYGSIGVEILPQELPAGDLNSLSRIIEQRLASLDTGKIDSSLLPQEQKAASDTATRQVEAANETSATMSNVN